MSSARMAAGRSTPNRAGAGNEPLPLDTSLLASYPADLGLVTIKTAAAANPSPVTGKTTDLSVLAADTQGESRVTYTWSATLTPLGATPVFSINGSNPAKNTTVTFNEAGEYIFTVTCTDGILFATSAVTVTVDSTLTSIAVSPSSASLNRDGTQLFTATGDDQFGNALTIPPIFTWSVDSGGVGSVDALGLYSAGTTTGTAVVRATSGAVSGTANVTVANATPTVVLAASAIPNPVTGTTTALSVLGTDDDAGLDLTYTWSATSSPAGSDPTFSSNGTLLSDASIVTFNMAGEYTLTVTISNGTRSTTSSVNVTVNQTLTSVSVAPASVDLLPDATQQFTATALDQFGNAMATQPSFTWSLAPSAPGASVRPACTPHPQPPARPRCSPRPTPSTSEPLRLRSTPPLPPCWLRHPRLPIP